MTDLTDPNFIVEPIAGDENLVKLLRDPVSRAVIGCRWTLDGDPEDEMTCNSCYGDGVCGYQSR